MNGRHNGVAILDSWQTMEVSDRTYQPSHAELREDLRLKGTFEDAMKELVQPVKVRKIMPAKR